MTPLKSDFIGVLELTFFDLKRQTRFYEFLVQMKVMDFSFYCLYYVMYVCSIQIHITRAHCRCFIICLSQINVKHHWRNRKPMKTNILRKSCFSTGKWLIFKLTIAQLRKSKRYFLKRKFNICSSDPSNPLYKSLEYSS